MSGFTRQLLYVLFYEDFQKQEKIAKCDEVTFRDWHYISYSVEEYWITGLLGICSVPLV